MDLDSLIEEWEYQHAQAFKMIIQSVDNANKIAIQSCTKASDAYETLVSRYGMKDTALLSQLLNQRFAVQSMKQSSVTEKYDVIVNLATQIAEQQVDARVPDIIQAVLLMRSLTSDYDTTIEILTSKDKFPTINEVFQAVKSTETKLDEPIIENEIANSTNNHVSHKTCWVCSGNHVKSQCPKWLSTEEGQLFKNSGLSWHKWQLQQKSKKEIVNSMIVENVAFKGKVVDFSDSKSESERSA